MKKPETSKILCLMTGSFFLVTTIVVLALWFNMAKSVSDGYSWMDCAILATVETVTGTAFTLCLTSYFNMNRFVNVVKVKMHAYERRLELLNKYGILNSENEMMKLNEAAEEIDVKAFTEEENVTQEIQNPLMFN